MKNKPKTAYAYCRVSTDRQVREGFSLGQQKKSCDVFAAKEGIEIIGYYVDEGESATVHNRPEFNRLLDDCEKQEVGYVIVFQTDRFARNTLDHFLIKDKLKKLGISLLASAQSMLDETPEGKLLDTVIAGMNQFYSEDLGRKTMKGMTGKWEQGWWPGWAPHGYMNINKENTITKTRYTKAKQKYINDLDREPHRIEKDPFLAPYIKKAFELYASNNYSYHNLGLFLATNGLVTNNHKPLAHSSIHQIITNPFYYGLMKWNGEERMGKHEPLITKKLFNHCQLIAAKKRHFLIRKHKHDFLLRGVVFCHQCGQRYTAE